MINYRTFKDYYLKTTILPNGWVTVNAHTGTFSLREIATQELYIFWLFRTLYQSF